MLFFFLCLYRPRWAVRGGLPPFYQSRTNQYDFSAGVLPLQLPSSNHRLHTKALERRLQAQKRLQIGCEESGTCVWLTAKSRTNFYFFIFGDLLYLWDRLSWSNSVAHGSHLLTHTSRRMCGWESGFAFLLLYLSEWFDMLDTDDNKMNWYWMYGVYNFDMAL